MVSINTTASNSFVLSSLRQTNKDIATVQTRIGTGYKVNSASDNSSVWATAQSIRADIKTQETSSAGISLAKAKADAGVAGLDKIAELLTKMQEVSDGLTTGASASELTSAGNKIAAYQTQITAAINASGFQGSNFLKSATAVSVKIGTDATATLSVTPKDLTAEASVTAAVGALVANESNIKAVSGLATTALATITGYQATLSTFSSGLDSQLDFQKSLQSIKETALSGLVDADMEQESARLTSLQVKQQLAYQALAITNSSSQNILALFR
jgi:flagellin